MKYSIIVPVHNVAQYLEQCAESVLSQSYLDFELLLIDDGSTDGSGKICDQYKRNDSRVKVFHQECKGVSAARNLGIEKSEGQYLIFLDSDDYWATSNALFQIDERNQNVDVIRFDYKIVREGEPETSCTPAASTRRISGEHETGIKFLESALENNPEFPWYCVMYAYKRSLWECPDKLRFPEGIRFHEDTATVYRILMRAQKVTAIQECIYIYRKRATSVSREDSAELLRNRVSVNLQQIDAVEQNKTIPEELKNLLCRNMATAFYTDLIHFGALTEEERKEIIPYLKQHSDRFIKYPATKKQKSVNKLLKVLGMNATCWILHIRRIIKHRNGF